MTGLLISLSLILTYFAKKRKWEKEQARLEEEAAANLPEIDLDSDVFNDTTMPEGLSIKVGMNAGDWDTKKNTCHVGIGIEFRRTGVVGTQKLYIHEIQVNGKLGGNKVVFDDKKQEDKGDYYFKPGTILYKNNDSKLLQYNIETYAMGGGTVSMSEYQLQNIKKIAEEKNRNTLRSIATADVLIKYSLSKYGNPVGEQWKTGIAQGIKCTLTSSD